MPESLPATLPLPTRPPVLILLTAAGAASRMRGGDKLTEEIAGEPLLRRQARAALATGAPVLVTLPPDRPARAAALAGLGAERRVLPQAAEGMSASLRCGAAEAAARSLALMVLPADMPELTCEDLCALLAAAAAAPESILRGASADGRPGHPVLFPPRCLAALQALEGDTGARSLLRSAPVQLIALPGEHALTDLDTPEDWQTWRATQIPRD